MGLLDIFGGNEEEQGQISSGLLARLTGVADTNSQGQWQAMGGGLINAGAAIAQANRPSFYGSPSAGDLLAHGAAGFTNGLGQQAMQRQQAALAAAKAKTEQTKAAQEQAQWEAKQRLAQGQGRQGDMQLAGGDTYYNELAKDSFAPAQMQRDIYKNLAGKGMVYGSDGVTPMQGYNEASAANAGAEAYARGINTPMSVQPGGQVVVPAMAMGGGQQKPFIPEVFRPIVDSAAQKTGVDPAVIAAIAKTESGFNPRAVSGAGAIGVMQLMPGTAQDLGVDPHDPVQSMQGGAAYYKQMLDRYGDHDTALAAYNWGPGNVDKWREQGADPEKLPRETRNYIQKVNGTLGLGAQGNANGVIYADPRPAPGSMETEEGKEHGKSLVRRYDGIVTEAEQARGLLNNLTAAKSIPIETGAFAPMKASVSAYAEAMGVNPEIMGLGNAADAQAITGVMQKLVLQEMQAQKGPQTENDAKRIEATVSNIGQSPEAFRYLLDTAMQVQQRKIERQDFYETYEEEHGTFKGADKAWRDWQGKNPLDLAYASAPQAQQAHQPTAQGAQPVQRLRFNPATGELE